MRATMPFNCDDSGVNVAGTRDRRMRMGRCPGCADQAMLPDWAEGFCFLCATEGRTESGELENIGSALHEDADARRDPEPESPLDDPESFASQINDLFDEAQRIGSEHGHVDPAFRALYGNVVIPYSKDAPPYRRADAYRCGVSELPAELHAHASSRLDPRTIRVLTFLRDHGDVTVRELDEAGIFRTRTEALALVTGLHRRGKIKRYNTMPHRYGLMAKVLERETHDAHDGARSVA